MDSISSQRRIGRYLLQEEVGRGGMGVVFAAFDETQNRRVALKLLRPGGTDQASAERFAQEMQIAISLEHPNVVPVYEIGTEDDVRYLAMRLVDGEDLGAVMRREGALDPARVGRLGRQIGSALDAAHARGLVHRDVKPGNVLLTGTGDEEHAYLTDFGLTRDADSGLTQTGHWIGTVDYAAPEQIEAAPLSARTDVYALGCVLYHALTGGLPFAGSFTAKAAAHVSTPLPSVRLPASQHGARIDAVLARATAKDPQGRYASAGELARALAQAVHGQEPEDGQSTVAMPAVDDGVTAIAPPQPAIQPREPRRARARPVPVIAPEPAAGPQPEGPAGRRAPRSSAPSGPRVAALALAALAVAGVIAIVAGGGGDRARPGAGSATKRPTATGKSGTSPTGTKTAAVPVVAPPTTAYTAAKGGYSTRVPAGWKASGEQDTGGILRTVFTGPDGQTLVIDATPSLAPGFGREGRVVTGVTRFAGPLGPIVAYRFTGRPEYCAGGCVDYQLDLGGHGFAVLAGPTPAARVAAHKAIVSLQQTASAPPTSPPPTAAPAPGPGNSGKPGKGHKGDEG